MWLVVFDWRKKGRRPHALHEDAVGNPPKIPLIAKGEVIQTVS